jgi:peptidoglycan/LPS O-acetylase OafA/YrhL
MSIKYRPEIDGLRAIAILSVIIYHSDFIIFGKSLLSGGFLGVDIFFLISGYLITLIILKEIYKKNNFSFTNFYEKRVRRIIPALLFVMLCTLPFAYIFLLDLVDFSKSIISSLFFISNIYFNFTNNRYGEEDALLKPFLNTWSLSVEEQFYIIFPIILLIIFKYFRKYFLIILIVIFFISILFAESGNRNQSLFNFYMISSRAWELVSGSILGYLEIKLKRRSPHYILNLILPFFGFILIAHSIFNKS